jgi:phage major head subunit gpT-like protein
MIINRANLQELYTGFNTSFRSGLQASVPKQRGVFCYDTPITSGSKSIYPWVSQLPRVREWIGERQARRLSGLKLEITNKPFESTVRVDRDDIEDDEYGSYAPAFLGMGQEGTRWKDEFVFGALNAAFSTVCWDGQYACDTDHPVFDENGVQISVSNSQGGSSAPWFMVDHSRGVFQPMIFQTRRDFSLVALDRETDPNVFNQREFVYGMDGRFNVAFAFWWLIYGSKQTLDATNFNSAYAAMLGMVTDGNKKLGVLPTHLVCGPSNRAAAKTVLAERLAGGADNPNFKAVELVVSPYLT